MICVVVVEMILSTVGHRATFLDTLNLIIELVSLTVVLVEQFHPKNSSLLHRLVH